MLPSGAAAAWPAAATLGRLLDTAERLWPNNCALPSQGEACNLDIVDAATPNPGGFVVQRKRWDRRVLLCLGLVTQADSPETTKPRNEVAGTFSCCIASILQVESISGAILFSGEDVSPQFLFLW